MSRFYCALAAATVLVLSPGAPRASLIGDSVTVTVSNPDAGFDVTDTATVGAGPEITFGGATFDFGADNVVLSVSGAFPAFFIFSGTTTIALTSLDLGSPITGVTVDSTTLPGLTVAFTATSASFSFPEPAPNGPGVILSATFLTGDVTVPEPAALALFGLGLLGLGAARRLRAGG